MRRWKTFLMLVLGAGFIFGSQSVACNYASKMRLYHKYLDRYLNDPTPANASQLCNVVRGIEIKFKNKPGKPTPPIPDGLDCDALMIGGGRGGGPGAVVVGTGQGAGSFLWARNHNDTPCEFTWTITPDPGNPAGFGLSATTGMVTVPALSSVPALFDIFVDPAVPNGTMAFFTVTWVDGCTGFPLFDDFASFKVTADSQISVVPDEPLFVLSPGVPLIMRWRVTNHTAATITRPYTYFHIGDPQSVAPLNTGGTYPIINTFLVDKSVSGGSATLQPFEEIVIEKEPLVAGEFCDPEMINCCGLDFGGATCCGIILNDDFGPRPIPPLFHDLVGKPTGLGLIGFEIGTMQVAIETDLLIPVPIQLEQLTLQGLNMAQNVNGFNFLPMLDQEGMMLLHAPNVSAQFFSTDPGLQWQPVLPPFLPFMDGWVLGEVPLPLLVETVNGWAVPPIVE